MTVAPTSGVATGSGSRSRTMAAGVVMVAVGALKPPGSLIRHRDARRGSQGARVLWGGMGMVRSRIIQGATALAIMGVTLRSGHAQEASPTAAISPVPPAECTIERRPIGELRQVVMRGIDDYVTGATPVPVAVFTAEESTPADAATVAAVTATIREFTACTNAGDFPAMAALATDEMMTRPLGRVAIYTAHLFAGRPGTPAPGETPTADELDTYLITLQFSQPRPQAEWSAILEIRDVRTLTDGRVRATVVTASQDEPDPDTDTVYLRWSRGRYLIEGTVRDQPTEAATPRASSSAP
jgi:hypothetical protein